MKIIPIIVCKITCSNGTKYNVHVDPEGNILEVNQGFDRWIGRNIKEVEDYYKTDILTWTFHYPNLARV